MDAFTALLADRDQHRDEARRAQMGLEQFAAQVANCIGLELKPGMNTDEIVTSLRARLISLTPKDGETSDGATAEPRSIASGKSRP